LIDSFKYFLCGILSCLRYQNFSDHQFSNIKRKNGRSQVLKASAVFQFPFATKESRPVAQLDL